MQLIKASYEILPQSPGLEGVYKQIELAGRTCYKSYDKITEDSAKGFVDRMIKSNHLAMLEHGTVYMYFPWVSIGGLEAKYTNNKYSKHIFYSNQSFDKDGNHKFIPIEYGRAGHYVTTNLRVLVENNCLDDLQYICEPTEYHKKRVTVKFTTDQGILREFTRHRAFSFAVESTRYCNYGTNKFNNEVTFIMPNWCEPFEVGSYTEYEVKSDPERWGNVPDGKPYYEWLVNGYVYYPDESEHLFLKSLLESEKTYLELLKQNWKPQQARNVLPLATKCDVVMTGFVSDWEHFFSLRADGTTGKPHPQAEELAKPLKEEFIKLGYVDN